MCKIRLIFALTVLAGLAACGGGGGGGGGNNPPPVPGVDGFTAAVQSIVAGSSDDTEPVSVDSTNTVDVDDGEPTST